VADVRIRRLESQLNEAKLKLATHDSSKATVTEVKELTKKDTHLRRNCDCSGI